MGNIILFIFFIIFMLIGIHFLILTGLLMNIKTIYKYGKSFQSESVFIVNDNNEIFKKLQRDDMMYSINYFNSEGLILVREKFRIFDFSLILKLRAIIKLDERSILYTIYYDPLTIFILPIIISFLFFFIIAACFDIRTSTIITFLFLIILFFIQKKIKNQILTKYNNLLMNIINK